MPVEPHSRAIRSTASAAAPGPWPEPPTSGALIKPESPAAAIASIAARGKAPSRSTSAEWAAAVSATASSFFWMSDSSWTMSSAPMPNARRRSPGPGGQRLPRVIRRQGLNPSGRCLGQVLVKAIRMTRKLTRCGRICRLLRYVPAVALLLALTGCGDDGSDCAFTTCGDGGVCAPEECDDRNTRPGDGCSETCTLEEPGCQDCIYRGRTSQGLLFEAQVEGGALTRVLFNARATKTACSTGAGCIDVAQVCFEVLFDPPAPGCALMDSACEDCP